MKLERIGGQAAGRGGKITAYNYHGHDNYILMTLILCQGGYVARGKSIILFREKIVLIFIRQLGFRLCNETEINTVCLRSLEPFYLLADYIILVKTSWTYSTLQYFLVHKYMYFFLKISYICIVYVIS